MSVDTELIARLLRPYAELNSEQLALTSKYIDLLLKWNTRVNLTAVRDPQEMITRHFGESLFAASHLIVPGWQGKVIDVGSGAGFPGLPIAMWAPAAQVTLIESNGKKAAFLNEVVYTLGLKNARVSNRRAEEFGDKAELVTMRAVEKFERALPIALGLIAAGGRIGLMIGSAQVQAVKNQGRNFSWTEPVAVPGGHSRVLLVGTRMDTSGKKGEQSGGEGTFSPGCSRQQASKWSSAPVRTMSVNSIVAHWADKPAILPLRLHT